jgi:uncharacterized protein YndB with AHSA1/START domain
MAILVAGTLRALAGEPVVHVETDAAMSAAHVRASIDIAAPPQTVWRVITDCARAPHIIPHLESCQIVKHDPAGRWDIREHVINWAALMPKIRTVVRNSYETDKRLLFKRVDGDMRVSQGEWKLEPNAHGTRLSYNAMVAPNFPVPEFMVEHAVHEDMPNLLRAIEHASEADAAKH